MIKAFKHFKNRVVECRRGGGGGTNVYQPTPPAQPTIGDTMQQYTESLPALYNAQMQYAPQMVEQQLGLLQDYGAQFGQATQEAQRAMNPETSALQEKLAGQASAGMDEGLSPEEMQMYRDQFAGNLGTNAGSGVGADYMGSSLVQANSQRKDYYRNLGLSLANRQPLASPSVQGQPNMMQGYSPGQALQASSQNYGSFAQASRPFVDFQEGTKGINVLGFKFGGY